jgi:hypothetical protein
MLLLLNPATPDLGVIAGTSLQIAGAQMDQKAVLDHEFVIAAYVVTWVVQLGYVAWLALKWRAQKRDAARLKSSEQ